METHLEQEAPRCHRLHTTDQHISLCEMADTCWFDLMNTALGKKSFNEEKRTNFRCICQSSSLP